MEFEKLSEAQIDNFKKQFGEIICIDKKNKAGEIEGSVFLRRPSAMSNYWSVASRFRQISGEGKDLAAGEMILKNCYLGGIKDFDTKNDKENLRNSAIYVGITIQCYQAANEDFMQGAQGLGFRIM